MSRRYTVRMRLIGAEDETAVRVLAEDEGAARQAAARSVYGEGAYFASDTPGVPHVGQVWRRLRGQNASNALSGRMVCRVEAGWPS